MTTIIKKSNPVNVGDLIVTEYAIGLVVEVSEHNNGLFWSSEIEGLEISKPGLENEVKYIDHDVLRIMIKYNGWLVNP